MGTEVRQEPTLVVYVVVDQLRADLLDRYEPVFTGGLARLHSDGRRFTQATFDHAQTSTSPGHATAATGVHPHRHGLVGNSWQERRSDGTWESIYALRDTSARIVGEPTMEGRGPANLARTGLPDWIQAHDPAARVVSLSGKDRSAIAMAGQSRGEVYWMDPARGRFLTSTHYRSDYPGWVERFHAERLGRVWGDTVWNSTVPARASTLSRPDTFPSEGDGRNTYFPHRASFEAGGDDAASVNEWRSLAPFPDVAVLELARSAVEELELGERGSVDYLALALSQVDRVGHEYGPLSREQLDNLIRLDQALGEFMAFLDARLGKDRWVLALTADHGVLEVPEARADLGLYGRRISPDEMRTMVGEAEAAAEAAGEDPLARARAAAAAASRTEWVADAFAWDDLLAAEPADSFATFYARSWHPERVLPPLGHLGVAIRVAEGVLTDRYPRGTSHGSPYLYDRHVPLIVMGPGIAAGADATRASVVDMAPTLAEYLGVAYPDDLDGRPLQLGARTSSRVNR